MTIAELREALADYPDDMRILVDGYEGGYDEPVLSGHRIADCEQGYSYIGVYDDYDPEDYGPDTVSGPDPGYFDAIVIGRS